MIQAAILGYGGMGKWHHNAIREQIEGVQVQSAYDVRPEARDEARANNLTVYERAQDLIDDPTISLAIIATPNDSHKDYIIRALKAGKHVVCEKPVVLTVRDLQEVMDVSKQTDALFTIHQNRRWDQDFQIVKTILDSGTVGKPYFIESRLDGSSVYLHGWRDYKLNGGGILYDWGVHLIDQALQLTNDKVTSVNAHLFSVHSKEVDDNIKVMLSFEDRLSVLIEASTNCFIPSPRWHVSGQDGTFVIQDWGCNGKIVQLADKNARRWDNDIVYTAAGPTRTMAPRPASTTMTTPLPTIKDARGNEYHRYSSADIFYHNLVASIEGKAELYVKAEEALRVMKIIELAFQSAEKQQGISCLV